MKNKKRHNHHHHHHRHHHHHHAAKKNEKPKIKDKKIKKLQTGNAQKLYPNKESTQNLISYRLPVFPSDQKSSLGKLDLRKLFKTNVLDNTKQNTNINVNKNNENNIHRNKLEPFKTFLKQNNSINNLTDIKTLTPLVEMNNDPDTFKNIVTPNLWESDNDLGISNMLPVEQSTNTKAPLDLLPKQASDVNKVVDNKNTETLDLPLNNLVNMFTTNNIDPNIDKSFTDVEGRSEIALQTEQEYRDKNITTQADLSNLYKGEELTRDEEVKMNKKKG